MEQMLLEFGIKESVFAGLFIWLFVHQLKTSQKREDKLYNFLDEMKIQFGKLVGSYEHLSNDVSEIREELQKKADKIKGDD